MRKLLLICFSLLLGLCMPVWAGTPERVEKPKTSKERLQRSGRRLSAIQNDRERPGGNNEIAGGVFLSESGAYLPPSKTRARQVPMAPEGTITTQKIYADKIYPGGDGAKAKGLKRVKLDGSLVNILASELRMSNRCIGIKNEFLYSFVWQKDDYGDISGAWFRTINLYTDEIEDVDLSEDFETAFIQGGAYVPEENAFYGYAYNCWIRFDVATKTAKVLAEPAMSSFNSQLTYNTKLRRIVGVNGDGEFYAYSKENGAATLLKATDVTSPYTAGLCYDAMSNHYLWSPNTDKTSELIAFDADSFEAVKVCDIEDISQLSVLFCAEPKKKDSEAPRVAEFVSASFPDGGYTGSVTFRLPVKRNDDTPISSNMDYKLFIKGVEYASGSGKAGENVTIPVGTDAGLKDGIYDFNLVCFLGTHESLDNSVNVYVGNDQPLKPANVKLTKDEITWDPVVAGVHNGYVDLNNLTYKVEVNGKVIAENLKDTRCAAGLDPDAELAAYVATVYAAANGQISAGGVSNDLAFGQPFAEPASFGPAPEQVKLFVVEDANNDFSTWSYHETSGAFRHEFDFVNDADDWLFLPPVNITKNDFLHEFSMTAWASDKEEFEVYVGREPSSAAMKDLVIGRSVTPGNEEKVEYSGIFDAPEQDVYYIGIHAVTPADKLYLYVKDMKVATSPVSKNGPAAVTDVVATAAPQGALSATVAFRLPEKNIYDAPLSGTVKAVVTCGEESKTVTGEPGSNQTVEVKTQQGNNHLVIQTFQGEVHGMPYETDVYTGIDFPGAPLDCHVLLNADNVSGTLCWKAPETGQNGGYISRTGITYYLCQQTNTIFGTTEWSIVEEIGTDVFEYSFSVKKDMKQRPMTLGVAAKNIAGYGNKIATTDFIIGIPHELPAQESFTGKNGPLYGPVMLSSNGESKVNWSIADPSGLGEKYAVNDAGAVIGTTATDTYGCVALPKFSTLGMKEVGFLPTFYFGGCENIRITATANGVEETEILDVNKAADIDRSEGYRQILVKLPEAFQNKGWVAVKVYPYFSPEHSQFVMDGYIMKNLLERDLAVNVVEKIRGTVGEPMALRAIVSNIGTTDCEFTGGKFTLLDRKGKVIAEKTVEAKQSIAPDKAVMVSCEVVPAIKDLGKGKIRFELTGTDMYAGNDKGEAACEIIKGKAIVVDNLKAKAVNEAVELSWTEPKVRNGAESFEDYVPFVTDDHSLGGFTNLWDETLDAYAVQVQGAEGSDNALADVMYKTGFHVYNSDTMNDIFGRGAMPYAEDGEQLLIAFCPGKQKDGNIPAADDWLISPLVEGGTQFSFSACPLINKYGVEHLEIRYSKEDTLDPSGFELLKSVEVGNNDPGMPVEWKTFSADLPAGAKRVAIRYVSRDILAVCVDNVKYVPAGGNLSVKGYEVYRAAGDASSFSRLGEVAECAYSDGSADLKAENRYYVLPVLSDGSRGVESNIAVVNVSGVEVTDGSRLIAGGNQEIVVGGYAGEQAVIATVDGKIVARALCSDVTRISAASGIYVVRVGGNVAKVHVR